MNITLKYLGSLSFILCLFGEGSFADSLPFQKGDAVIDKKKEGSTVLLNLYPHQEALKKIKECDREKSILESVQHFLSSEVKEDENVGDYTVKVVMIKNLDEYARPDYKSMVRLGTLHLKKNKGEWTSQNDLDMGTLNKELQ